MISGLKASVIVTTAVYAALGDKDEAFRILEKAIEERNSLLVVLKEDPPLRICIPIRAGKCCSVA
ncbi:MAG: hypothetical protein L0387_29605 [Acidobacteria bacterium]|nr:hypothetical protein [Acidobacteriota bacterium]MCI0720555.1 hypothetical protein [Acidobacteriota bacterium]